MGASVGVSVGDGEGVGVAEGVGVGDGEGVGVGVAVGVGVGEVKNSGIGVVEEVARLGGLGDVEASVQRSSASRRAPASERLINTGRAHRPEGFIESTTGDWHAAQGPFQSSFVTRLAMDWKSVEPEI